MSGYQTPDSHINQKGELQRSCGWFVHGRMLLYAALSLLRVSFLARLCKSLKTLQHVQLWRKLTISFQSHQLLIKAKCLAPSCYMKYDTSHLHHCKVACLKKVEFKELWKHKKPEVLYCHHFVPLYLGQFNMCHSMTKRIQIFLHDNQTVEAELIRFPYLARSQNPWTDKDWNLIEKIKNEGMNGGKM